MQFKFEVVKTSTPPSNRISYYKIHKIALNRWLSILKFSCVLMDNFQTMKNREEKDWEIPSISENIAILHKSNQDQNTVFWLEQQWPRFSVKTETCSKVKKSILFLNSSICIKMDGTIIIECKWSIYIKDVYNTLTSCKSILTNCINLSFSMCSTYKIQIWGC